MNDLEEKTMTEQHQYYYNLETLRFISDFRFAFMDNYLYALRVAPKRAGQDVMVALSDLARIYAPAMRMDGSETGCALSLNGKSAEIRENCRTILIDGAPYELANAPEQYEGELCVPAGELMRACFGKALQSSVDPDTRPDPVRWRRENVVVQISEKSGDGWPMLVLAMMELAMRGKHIGEQHNTYWFEEAGKVMPYILYVPTTYSPEKSSKLIVALHGGGSGEQRVLDVSENRLQFLCEKYNYILLCPNACVRNSTWGCIVPNLHWMDAGKEPLSTMENPMGFTEKELYEHRLGHDCAMEALRVVMRDYNIDREHIYLMGNSMGGIGTFHLAAAHPGLFRTIAPSGANPNMEYFNISALQKTPVRFVAGTEDRWGFDRLDEAAKRLAEGGCNLTYCKTAAGHAECWVVELDETFRFFEKNA